MSENKTQFQVFLENEVRKVQGVYVPVRAGWLRRALIRRVSCRKLHPNPDDEFCRPEVGPNYGIISGYEKDYRTLLLHPIREGVMESGISEPLIVERIRPDGYMILNGHHRWAAALRTGFSNLPVKIVDLTQEKDIMKMLSEAKHEKRVTLDLDEVVFRTEGDELAEKALPFPFGQIYRERLRLGIPALFRFLGTKGYDIWVYSSGYYSVDYIRQLFRKYHADVNGIVTGTARKRPKEAKNEESLESRLSEKYPLTVHIDNDTVLRINNRTKEFREFSLKDAGAGWSKEIMGIIGEMEEHG